MASCGSSPSYSSSSYFSYDDIYPVLVKARSYLENNNTEGAKNVLSGASQRDKLTTLYAICAKEIRGFNYRNHTREMITFLINRNVDVNETGVGEFPASPKQSIAFNEDLTALMLASSSGNFEAVQVLLDNGAKINLRDKDGATSLSKAYDKGEMEIYNYLIEHGAIVFESRQVVQATPPSTQTTPSTTNIIVQPAAPAQTAPAQPRPATPTLQTGTYAANRTNITMHLNLGQVTASSGRDPVAFGTYTISGNQLAVTFDARTPSTGAGASLRGNTYVYTITSNATFSGNGEEWIRTGY